MFKVIGKHLEFTLVLLLLIFSAFLRFYQLGYSDYIPDEPTSFIYYNDPEKFDMSVTDFLLNQRKGPMQFLVSYIPYAITGDFNNELAERIPFAILNTFSILLFYLFVKKTTKSWKMGILAASLLSVNGFVVAFGRITQYQSLNLFFSFASLYFYSFLLDKNPSKKLSLLATFMFCLSFLSHWDAVLILPFVAAIFLKFLLRKDISRNFKIKTVLLNLILGCVVLLPFLIPYYGVLNNSQENLTYLQSRIGLKESLDYSKNIFRFTLYNPFLATWVYLIGGALGVLFIKRSRMFVFWAITVLIYYTFFVHHAGTHIYNLLIPWIVIISIGVVALVEKFSKYIKVALYSIVFLFIAFFYYQSYIIFVDHKNEYPWEREIIIKTQTPKYTHEKIQNNKIGFPHKRYWKKINAWVNEQNAVNKENLSFVTNEDSSISSYYMDSMRRSDEAYYVIGIKTPYSFSNDWKMSQIKNKRTVHKIENEDGKTIVRIYRVDSP